MEIRFAEEKDYIQLAEMKWSHCEEDDEDYGEHSLADVDKQNFISEFIEFLNEHKEYLIFVAMDNDIVMSAMFVYQIVKTPKPNRNEKYISYLTNVYTRKGYRNQGVGTALLNYIKKWLVGHKSELLFAWPSGNSVEWYSQNGFSTENEMFECDLVEVRFLY